MAWRRPCDKPLSRPMMVNLPTHIHVWVTRPQWVNLGVLPISPAERAILPRCSLEYVHLCFVTSRHSAVVKNYRLLKIDSFVFDQCGLRTEPCWIILESITLGVSFLKLCTFVPPRRSLQHHTGPEFAAKFLKHSSVHLDFILVRAIMMKKYTGNETLHNNEDVDKMFSTKKHQKALR